MTAPPTTKPDRVRKRIRARWGPLKSLLALSPMFVFTSLLAIWFHQDLPTPLTELINPITHLPQLSESRILNISRHLSEEIGYRTVGTYEHAQGDVWLHSQMVDFQKQCDQIVAQTHGRRKLECEVWHQRGSGSHRFDMMGKRLYKTYVNLTNTVVRLSNGTPQGKEHAILVNAHLDSTLPSPGAADDALCIGVMMEVMRVLVQTPGWEPEYSIVFLFNNAEESLQDGSHLFSTQHPIAPTVRAVINLEAAGTTGRELLFQATSEQMIEAYSHVPRPFGTILANDIFSSGVILSDTDFRQFEQYLNVTGLDMAIVGNSYLYHMRKDLVENIQPGIAQHMSENTLALLKYLSSPSSPLPTLTEGYTPPSTVFFSHIGMFVIYSFATARMMYSALLAASVLFVWYTTATASAASANGNGWFVPSGQSKVSGGKESKGNSGDDVWSEQGRGAKAVLGGLLGGLVSANMVALIMSKVLGKGMSWFSNEYSVIILYGIPTLLGILTSQYLLGPIMERTVFTALLLVQATSAFALQMVGIGSAVLFFMSALPLFVGLVLNPVFVGFFWACEKKKKEKEEGERDGGRGRVVDISLVTYTVAHTLPMLTGVMLMLPVLEFFVPLTGRIGADAPADNIIATVVSVLGFQTASFSVAFAHRFSRRSLFRGIVVLGVLLAMVMAVFVVRQPFDEMHQKRMFVLYLENITSGETHMHISAADGAPGFAELVGDIASEFGLGAKVGEGGREEGEGEGEGEKGGSKLVPVVMNEYNSDWDTLYPFSSFLIPYKIPVGVEPGYVSPWGVDNGKGFTVRAVNDVKDFVAGTRSLRLEVYHPGLIWTVIAFDAHVLQWTLDSNPPNEHARHHIKEASFYGTDVWGVDLVMKLGEGDDGRLRVNFIGIEEAGMWPGKKNAWLQAQEEEGRMVSASMGLFERLDGWLEDRKGGTVDALLMGCVAGVVDV